MMLSAVPRWDIYLMPDALAGLVIGLLLTAVALLGAFLALGWEIPTKSESSEAGEDWWETQ